MDGLMSRAAQAPAAPPQLSAEAKALASALRSKDPKVRSQARHDLLNLTFRKIPAEQAVPVLLPLLSPPATELEDANFQGLLMEYLARIYGPAAKAALPRLRTIIVDDKVMIYLRGQAIWAAARIGPGDPEVVAALIKAIENPRPETSSGVHDRAAQALGEMGKAAWRARPALLLLLEHRFDIVQDSAFIALGQLARDQPAKPAEEYVRRLAGVGRLPADQVAAALLALQFTPPAEQARVAALARPALVSVLEQRRKDIYTRATLRTLTALGPGSSPRAVKAILTCLLRDSGGEPGPALEKVEATDKRAVEPLTEALEKTLTHPSWHTRVLIARALGRYGKDAAPAAPALVKALRRVQRVTALNDAYSEELKTYLDALGKIGGHRPDALRATLDLLDPKSELLRQSGSLAPYTRAILLRGLGGLGLPADGELRAAGLARLGEGLAAESPEVFIAAAGGVLAAGKVSEQEAAALVPRLLRVLQPGFEFKQKSQKSLGDPPGARLTAIRALRDLGPAARAALPSLQRLAERPLDRRRDFKLEPVENAVTRAALQAVKAIRADSK
jgi:hypothetical protein